MIKAQINCVAGSNPSWTNESQAEHLMGKLFEGEEASIEMLANNPPITAEKQCFGKRVNHEPGKK